MNKEVILEIKRSLASALGFDRNDPEATFIDIEARDLYKRIASHFHREFPRETIEELFNDGNFRTYTQMIDALERLWNGGETAVQESISEEGMGILRELAKLATSGKLKIPGDASQLSDRAMMMLHKKPACTEKPKKDGELPAEHADETGDTCPTCRGSGEVPPHGSTTGIGGCCCCKKKPCPDCTEKPKKDRPCVKIFNPKLSDKDVLEAYHDFQKGAIVDQRKGERRVRASHQHVCQTCRVPWDEDRRKGDRRDTKEK